MKKLIFFIAYPVALVGYLSAYGKLGIEISQANYFLYLLAFMFFYWLWLVFDYFCIFLGIFNRKFRKTVG